MNLSPRWVDLLRSAGHDALRWSEVGAPDAPDEEVMGWAEREGYTVLTHDQDFNTLLAYSRAGKPSVVLVRTSSLRLEKVGARVLASLDVAEDALEAGAILVVRQARAGSQPAADVEKQIRFPNVALCSSLSPTSGGCPRSHQRMATPKSCITGSLVMSVRSSVRAWVASALSKGSLWELLKVCSARA